MLFASAPSFAQINFSSPSHHNKWRVGGGLGLNFGSNDYFGFTISPFIGYEIIRNLEGGLALGYQYSKSKYYKQNLFDIGPYLNFYPISSLFLRARYDYYTGNRKIKATSRSRNFDENALWLGGGYRSGGGNVHFYVGLMYNVLYDKDKSLFSNGFRPIVGVSIGI